MSKDCRIPVVQRRLMVALCIVVVLITIAPVSDVLARAPDRPDAALESEIGFDISVLSQEHDLEGLLEDLEGMVRASESNDVPAWFHREIAFMPQAHDVRFDGSSVVGYIVEGDSSEVLEELVSHMEARGWTAVPLGDVDGATFMKPTGACTWALATCTQVGSATCIVFRCNVA